jgi:hypothetical protein
MSEIIEAIGKIIQGGFGFRYLFSRNYRERTRERWKTQSRMSVAFEVIEAVIGMGCIIIILFVLFGVLK